MVKTMKITAGQVVEAVAVNCAKTAIKLKLIHIENPDYYTKITKKKTKKAHKKGW